MSLKKLISASQKPPKRDRKKTLLQHLGFGKKSAPPSVANLSFMIPTSTILTPIPKEKLKKSLINPAAFASKAVNTLEEIEDFILAMDRSGSKPKNWTSTRRGLAVWYNNLVARISDSISQVGPLDRKFIDSLENLVSNWPAKYPSELQPKFSRLFQLYRQKSWQGNCKKEIRLGLLKLEAVGKEHIVDATVNLIKQADKKHILIYTNLYPIIEFLVKKGFTGQILEIGKKLVDSTSIKDPTATKQPLSEAFAYAISAVTGPRGNCFNNGKTFLKQILPLIIRSEVSEWDSFKQEPFRFSKFQVQIFKFAIMRELLPFLETYVKPKCLEVAKHFNNQPNTSFPEENPYLQVLIDNLQQIKPFTWAILQTIFCGFMENSAFQQMASKQQMDEGNLVKTAFRLTNDAFLITIYQPAISSPEETFPGFDEVFTCGKEQLPIVKMQVAKVAQSTNLPPSLAQKDEKTIEYRKLFLKAINQTKHEFELFDG